jgi:uncharacterized protein YjbI with pentapeptide repeats
MMAQFSAWWSWLHAGATDAVTAWWPWLLAGAVAGAVLYGAWWLWWRLPKRQINRFRIGDAKARADVEDNFRKTIGQLLGGAAVLLGAALAYLQFTEQQRNTQKQFVEQQDASRKQFEQQQQAARDLLVSNQVAKGFELLGNKDSLTQRLGGIYALEGVMNTSEQYHQPVLEALSAFVCDGTKTVTGDVPPATDIQAALTVIGRRKPVGEGRPNLAGAHIPRANLGDANLNRALLDGADLSGAYLIDANLNDAFLSGAILRGAHLNGAILRGAKLRGLPSAHLSDADLSGANLTKATVSQAQLDQACGTDAKLDPGLTLKPCP